MRPFQLIRDEDETGVSGTGVVAEGIIYSDGHVSLRWGVGEYRSTVAYDSIEAVEAILGRGGKTRIEVNRLHPHLQRRAKAEAWEVCASIAEGLIEDGIRPDDAEEHLRNPYLGQHQPTPEPPPLPEGNNF